MCARPARRRQQTFQRSVRPENYQNDSCLRNRDGGYRLIGYKIEYKFRWPSWPQRSAIDGLMQAVQAAKSLTYAQAIEAVTQAQAKGTEAFAALRMNRGIQCALSGRHIASL